MQQVKLSRGQRIQQQLLPLCNDHPTGSRARLELHWQVTETLINPIQITAYPEGHIPGKTALPRHWQLQGYVHAFAYDSDIAVVEPFFTSADMDTLEYFMDSYTEPTVPQFLEYVQRRMVVAVPLLACAGASLFDPEQPPSDNISIDKVFDYAVACGFDRHATAETFVEQCPAWQWQLYKTAMFFYHLHACRPYYISADQAATILIIK